MPLELTHVDFSDGDELAEVQVRANAETPLSKAFHPGLSFEASLANTKERWPSVYGFGPWYTTKVVDTETGKAVSVMRCMMDPELKKHLPALTGIPEGLELPPRKPPTSLDRDIVGQYGQQSHAVMEREVGERPCIALDMMGTLPEFRGQGAASLMLQWVTDFADEHDQVCSAEVPGEDFNLFSKYGFKKRDTIKLNLNDGTVLPVAVLIREPKKRGGN